MEADFNGVNKTVYGIQMLEQARWNNLMPEEVFSERNKMADDGTLTKVITYDIIHQTRRSAGVALVDADNCYNWIAHAIASLVFQVFGVPLSASESMLTTIQEMKKFSVQALVTLQTLQARPSQLKHKDFAKAMGHPQQDGQWSVSVS